MVPKFALLLLISVWLAAAAPGEYEARVDKSLKQLRDRVGDDLYRDFMKTDAWLVPFLRAKKFDVKAAAENIKKTLAWRKSNRIDEAETEDFSYYEKNWPISFDGVDREGRPIMHDPFGEHDIRKAALSGRITEFTRYKIIYTFDRPAAKTREYSQATGRNITQALAIWDLSGFNFNQHACVVCIAFYVPYVTSYENHYPELFYKLVVPNTPQIFERIMQIIRPIFSEATKSNVAMFGYEKKEWQKELRKYADPEQLSRLLGGKRKGCNLC